MAEEHSEISVFFISYLLEKDIKITFNEHGECFGTPEKKDIEDKSSKDGNIYHIVRFSVPIKKKEEKKPLDIKIICNYKEGNIISRIVKIFPSRANFLFSLDFQCQPSDSLDKKYWKFEVIKTSEGNPIQYSHSEQLKEFLSYIKGNSKLKENVEKKKTVQKALIVDCMIEIDRLNKNKIKPDLTFFMDIFRECFLTNGSSLLRLFKPNFIEIPRNQGEGKKYLSIIEMVNNKKKIIVDQVKVGRGMLYKKIDELSLFFYRHFEKDKMIDYIKSGKLRRKSLIDILLSNYISFQGLNKSEIESLVNICKEDYKEKEIDCLKLIGPFENFLDIVPEFLYLFENQSATYRIEEVSSSQLDSKDNLKKIFEKYISLRKKAESEKITSLNFDISNYIEKYIILNKNDTNNLIVILSNIDQVVIEDEEKTKNLSNYMYESLNKSLEEKNSQGIAEFLNENPLILDYLDEKKKMEIIKKINLENIEEKKKFASTFRKIKWETIFKEEKQQGAFAKELMESIKKMDNFLIIFELFTVNSDMNSQIKNEIIAKFNDLLKENSEGSDTKIFIQILFKIRGILSENEYRNIFTEKLAKAFPSDEWQKIICEFFTEYGNDVKELRKIVIKKFLEEVKDAGAPGVLEIVKLIKKFNLPLNDAFSNISKLTLTEEDLDRLEETQNFKFFEEIGKMGCFNDMSLENTDYFKNLKKSVTKFKEVIIKQTYGSKKLQVFIALDKDKRLEPRLTAVCFGNKEEGQKLYKEVKKKMEFYEHFSKVVGKMYEFYEFYYPKEEEFTKGKLLDIRDLKGCLEKKNFNEYESKENKFNIYEEEFEKKKEFIDVLDSNFFKSIYKRKLQGSKKVDKVDKAQKIAMTEFKNLENLLDEERIKHIKQEIIEILVDAVKKKEVVLENEFNFLKKYFGKEDKDTEKSEEAIELLANAENMHKVFKGIINLFESFEIKNGDVFNLVKRLAKEFGETKKEVEDVQNAKKEVEKYGIILTKSPFVNLLTAIQAQPSMIEFVEKKDEKIIKGLIEFVKEADDCYVNENDIRDLQKVHKFIKELRTNSNKSDKEFLKTAKDLIEKSEDIGIYVQNVCRNFSELQDVFEKVENREEFSQKIFENLIKYSKFEIKKQETGDKIECKVIYKKGDKKEEKKFEEILEIKERALLKKTQNEEEDKAEKITNFSKKIIKIEKILEVIQELISKGSSDKFQFTFDFQEENVKIKTYWEEDEDEDKKTLNKIIEKLEKSLEEIKETLETEQKKNILSTFTFGKQLNLLVEFCRSGASKDCQLNVEYFFKNLTSNNVKGEIAYDYNSDESHEFKKVIENVSSFMKKILDDNKLKLENLFSSVRVKGKESSMYLSLLGKDSFEKEVVSYYHQITGGMPISISTLICSKETTTEEIESFINRAVYCKEKVMFSIETPEKLDIKSKHKLIEILTKVIDVEMTSTLVFFYSTKTDSVNEQIQKLLVKKRKDKCYLNHLTKNKNDDSIRNIKENIEIVKSNASGVGKSYQICKKAREMNLKYVYFPVSGDFTKEDLISRLQREISPNEEKVLLHIDLQTPKNPELMKHFLYCILILGSLVKEDKIFYLDPKIKVMVEIPFGFTDPLKEYSILQLFKVTEYDKESMPKLEVPQDIYSDFQVVCAYLKHLEEVNSKNFVFTGITQRDIRGPKLEISTPLSSEECESLIRQNLDIKNPSFYQITSFVSFLGTQLKSFTEDFYLDVENLRENLESKGITEPSVVRKNTVLAFIKITKHFTKGAFEDIISQQDITYRSQTSGYDADKATEEAIERLTSKKPVSFDNINPPLTFFNADGQSLSIISTFGNSPRNDEEKEYYKALMQLWNSDKITNNEEKLVEYKKIDQIEFLRQIKKVLSATLPVTKEEKEEKKKNKRQANVECLEEVAGDYVFTADNFIKMILVLLRIRAKIPVILMGETGCGKTFLVRMLSKFMNSRMEILNIHAGITDKEIVQFMNKHNLIGEERVNLGRRNGRVGENEFWVFLDEINTCCSMGLISEMMCKRTMQGQKIRPGVVFIAACNPYRKVEKKQTLIGLIKENHKVRNLVYAVYPLPHCLLNYVFDFGSLRGEDEKRYVENMLEKPILNYIKNKESKDFIKLKELGTELISTCQNFIREKNDASSVSLREVRRFVIFFEGYIKFFENKNNYDKINVNNNDDLDSDNENDDDDESKTTDNSVANDNSANDGVVKDNAANDNNANDRIDITNFKKAMIMATYLCYQMRIFDIENRNELISKIPKNNGKNFNKIVDSVIDFIVERIKLPPGIARNRALKENIFGLFSCINQKVPIFICGKPGCSKSLSVKLLYKSMKGKTSEDDFFKKFPRLLMTSYQGSMTSTSKGVKSAFDKARTVIDNNEKRKKKGNNEEVTSLLFFDEMGLAEISEHNPLKVIHSELEYDQNEKKIAFVGISNWNLDASKMNRGIYISIPEPKEKDLEITAEEIAKSYKGDLDKRYKPLFDSLAFAYNDYKNYLKKNYNNSQDFHGTRDFYHLIRNTSYTLLEHQKKNNKMKITESQTLGYIVAEAIERNFGGMDWTIKKFKEFFNKRSQDKDAGIKIKLDFYDVRRCIENNIKDPASRYLLVISRASIGQFLISSILKKMGKEYTFLIGSRFEDDQKDEIYSARTLNKILQAMEKGHTLILKDLDGLYPSLYDLFNQNFTLAGEKQYTRIALGSTNNSMSEVHKDFRVIILVNDTDEDIQKQEAPFLNRFEKHIFSIENLLKAGDKKNTLTQKAKEIEQHLNDLITPKSESNTSIVDLKSQLINCSSDEILSLCYFKSSNVEEAKLSMEIEKILVSTFSQDIIGFSRLSKLNHTKAFVDLIIKNHDEYIHSNLKDYLTKTKSKKSIIYTFTNSTQPIIIPEGSDIENNELFEILVSNISSEQALEKKIKEFYDKAYRFCLIKFLAEDCLKIEQIKFFIDNYEKSLEEEQDKDKNFVFIVYTNRVFARNENEKKVKKEEEKETEEAAPLTLENQPLISHLAEEYNQTFIDDLNGEDITISGNNGDKATSFGKIMMVDKNENFFEEDSKKNSKKLKLINLDTFFEEKTIDGILVKIDYKYKNAEKDQEKDDYHKNLIQSIKAQKENFCKIMKRYFQSLPPFIETIFKNRVNFSSNQSVFSILKGYIQDQASTALLKLICKMEEDGFLFPYLKSDLMELNSMKKISENYLKEINLSKVNVKEAGNEIKVIMNLKIPGSVYYFKKLIASINASAKEKMFEEEDKLRNLKEKEKEDDIKNKFETEENTLFKVVCNEFKANEGFSFLYKDKENFIDKKFDEVLMSDYLKIFLSKKFDSGYSNLEEIIKILADKRFDKVKESDAEIILESLCKKILWIETYNIEIYKICEIYNNLQPFLGDFLEKLKDNNEDEDFIDNEVEATIQRINKPFYSFLEALSKQLFENCKDINEQKSSEIFEKTNKIKIEINNISEINYLLKLDLKELYNLKSYIKVFEAIQKSRKEKKKENIYILKEYVELLAKEPEKPSPNIQEDEINSTKDFIEKQKKFITDYFGDEPNRFSKLYISISTANYRKNPNAIKDIITETIANNATLLKHGKKFFKVLFSKYALKPLKKEEEDDEDTAIESFSRFSKNEDCESLEKLESLGNQENRKEILDDVLLNFFETNISFFFSKNKDIKFLTGIALQYLDVALKYLDQVTEEEQKPKLAYIGTLYYVAYTKCFLKNYVEIVYLNNEKLVNKDTDDIKNVIDPGKMSNFRIRVLKGFILKLFRSFCKDYDEFKKFNWEKFQMKWLIKDIDFNEDQIKRIPFEYCFFNVEKNDKYVELNDTIETYRNGFPEEKDQAQQTFFNDNFFVSYDLFANKFFSYLSQQEYASSDQFYEKFSKWMDIQLNSPPNISEETKIIYSLFCKKEKFIQAIKPINLDFTQTEILCYSLKFALGMSKAHKKGFYKELCSKDAKKAISNNYIPGGEPINDRLINSFNEISQILNFNSSEDDGIYLCSCNAYYLISPCGLPKFEMKCPFCEEKIGGLKHKLLEREGHRRVYKDAEQRKKIKDKYNFTSENVLLEDLRKDFEAKEKRETKGIEKNTFLFYQKRKYVRGLSEVAYRFLSFIFYSGLFFSNKAGFISDEDTKNFLFEEEKEEEKEEKKITCLNVLEKAWELLEKALKKKNIFNIRVFMNTVFQKIIEEILESGEMDSIEKRKTFEDKVSKILEDGIKNYQKSLEDYTQKTVNLLGVSQTSTRNLINESSDPSLFNKAEYPLLKYFFVSEYPSLDKIKKQIDLVENKFILYPVLSNFFKSREESKIMKNLPLINPFANKMLTIYSCAISRKKAKEDKISSVIEKDDQDFNDFMEGWNDAFGYKDDDNDNEVQEKVKYKEGNEMEPVHMSDSQPLAYCLNDEKESGYGMLLAALYEKFQKTQNNFLNGILKSLGFYGELSWLREQILNEIQVQKATQRETINLEVEDDYSRKFESMLTSCTNRICYNKDNKVVYTNYKEIEYDLNGIEQKMGKILLKNKRLFSKEQDFIIYENEGKTDSILTLFYNKFPQKKLECNRKAKILKEIKTRKIEETLVHSIQNFFLLVCKSNPDEKKIKDIISAFEGKYQINKKMKEFFEAFDEIEIDTLFGVYEISEYLIFEQIKKSLSEDYQKELSEEDEKQIEGYFSKNKNEAKGTPQENNDQARETPQENNDQARETPQESTQNILITKSVLASAVRKYISRYIIGKKEEPSSDKKEKETIIDCIKDKENLWEFKAFKKSSQEKNETDEEKFISEIQDMRETMKITVDKCIAFYEKLGKDDELYKEELEQEAPDSKPKGDTNSSKPKPKSQKKRGNKRNI